MITEDKKFWEQVKNYDQEVTSVFIEKNELIKKINLIKNKNKKIIADFGCGTGNSIPYISKFKKIYQIDFSENLLKQNKNIYINLKNIEYINQEISKTILKEKVDVIIAINSIFPKKYDEFDEHIINLVRNIKKEGEIILILPSFEALTFLYQIESHYKFNNGLNPIEIKKYIQNVIVNYNYDPLGYVITASGLIQKYWLKEEIEFRLQKYNFKKLSIEKLNLNWKTQLKKPEYINYPKFWFWMISIKI